MKIMSLSIWASKATGLIYAEIRYEEGHKTVELTADSQTSNLSGLLLACEKLFLAEPWAKL